MTCDETLWPCWMCRETAVWVEDSARMSGTSGGLDGRLGQQIKTAPNAELVPPAGAWTSTHSEGKC